MALTVGYLYLTHGGTIGQKPLFEQYLKDKYGQEFVVEDVVISGSRLGGEGYWVADAHPKSDPALHFSISRSQSTWKIDKDTFLQTLWTKEGTSEAQKFVDITFPNNGGFYLRISPGSVNDSSYQAVRGKVPTLAEARKDKLAIAYTLYVDDVRTALSDEPSEGALQSAMKVTDFVKSQGVISPTAGYRYRDSSFTQPNSAKRRLPQYGFEVKRDQLLDINTADDLRDYFRKF